MDPIIILGNTQDPDLVLGIYPNHEPPMYVDERDPASNRRAVPALDDTYADVAAWHQDNNTHFELFGTPHLAMPTQADGLILWSNDYPTELLLRDGTITSGDPGDVVLFDNRIIKHRLPADYKADVRAFRERDRWLVRIIIPEWPSTIEVERIRRHLAVT